MDNTKSASRILIIIAFITVYLVWGSTYFFISMGVEHIPPYTMAGMRFLIAGTLLLSFCGIKKLPRANAQQIKTAGISGIFLLFISNGSVGLIEKTLPSSLVAIFLSATPISFVLLDKPMWKTNFHSKPTLIGLLVGLVGVVLLFTERLGNISLSGSKLEIICMAGLVFTSLSWAGGSLYSKYYSTGHIMVTTAWQMLIAGVVCVTFGACIGEIKHFHPMEVPMKSWLALAYLVVFGSLAGYSAYVWLLQVCTATQVSTHAYVNPVVAVILGVFFANETMSTLQFVGLVVILVSLLLINLAKYRKAKTEE
ncbi:Permease of the drug/metabolite transporter (DMT) superfamily [Filimonas lacunae]|uniref:Permease of the drug/metabolite transporter (DMT) superfamily n=1 Tax=Filimonas lacunae TaxID=477680 RepID=A0A173MQ07_9BACT|nr:EamA family transporter [Filimonas lacunae]BAV09753.1 permease of the drug/metabolite transporter (DMT) superfamily [Filimonas lacunae]SIS78464.1 Permease of the drug/metabolite transporter (DMT) superfamily [Filimonas lacunae]